MGEKELDDGEVFVRLLMEHEPSVRGFLRGLLPSWNDVDEVIQNASMIAWRKFSDFERGTSFGGWFLTIAKFEALKQRRQLARTPLKFADDIWNILADEAIEKPVPKVRLQYLEVCLGRLRPEQKQLILKAHEPGAIIRDVASQSGKSEQAFYKMIQRLRELLSNCVSELSKFENA